MFPATKSIQMKTLPLFFFSGFAKGVCSDECDMLLINVIKSVAFN